MRNTPDKSIDDKRAEFERVANERYDEFIATGMSIPWESMRTYLLNRAAGKPARPPRARKLRTAPVGAT